MPACHGEGVGERSKARREGTALGLSIQDESISIYFARETEGISSSRIRAEVCPWRGVALVILSLGKHVNCFLHKYIIS